MTKITPVLLAGGSGTRLWPLSRKSYPKQFTNLIENHSLFQECALRLTSSKIVDFAQHITMTNSDFRFIVGEQLQQVGVDPGPILIEPEGRNTAPSILAACMYVYEKNKDAVLLIAPSDHIIPNTFAFHEALKLGLTAAETGKVVTFGITPTRAETGYGYLELEHDCNNGPVNLKKFIEKPNYTLAQEMVASGHYLWNSGIFMFQARDMIEAFKMHAPEFIEPVKGALSNGRRDLDFLRLDKEAWSGCNDTSIDYAIMEKIDNIVAVPFSAGWSDMGDWNSVLDHMEKDNNGVAVSQNAHAFDCKNTLLRSESENLELVGIGLEDIVAIAMPDAVLVAKKDRSQDVKLAIQKLKLTRTKQAEILPKDHRPWGWFETLALGSRFQVKRIFVKPGAALSLQSHHHRSEHWVVVEGTAKITIADSIQLVTEGQSVYVPLGALHRMENPGKVPMVLIEVQIGTYLGEDDIVRYEDIYDRGQGAKG